MELRHLRYFVTAAEELSISRAAPRLRVSAPVNRQIPDLEEEIGTGRFDLGNKRLLLIDCTGPYELRYDPFRSERNASLNNAAVLGSHQNSRCQPLRSRGGEDREGPQKGLAQAASGSCSRQRPAKKTMANQYDAGRRRELLPLS